MTRRDFVRRLSLLSDYANSKLLAAALALATLGIASGCATTGTQPEDSDPLESANRTVYGFNDALDDYLLEPIADNYVKYVPQPMRTGVSNFFDNVTYLDVILNDFLQAKGIQGLSDTGRFVVNSTVGFGGIFDPATAWGMSRHDEDFGQTLAVWGTGEGFYLELPILGPSSLRDLPGVVMGFALNPLIYLPTVVTIPTGGISVVNGRATVLPATRIREEAAIDPYSFTRSTYRQKRLNAIYDGAPPEEEKEFLEGDTEATE